MAGLDLSESEDESGFNRGGLGDDWPQGQEPKSVMDRSWEEGELEKEEGGGYEQKSEKVEKAREGEGLSRLEKMSAELGWTWGSIGELPEAPREVWEPEWGPAVWAETMFGMLPQPLQ